MEPLRKDLSPIKMRNYGRILQDVVSYVCTLEDSPERRALIVYVAQCMRQKNLVWNKDQESGLDRIKTDIYKMSEGKLNCDFLGFEEVFCYEPKKLQELLFPVQKKENKEQPQEPQVTEPKEQETQNNPAPSEQPKAKEAKRKKKSTKTTKNKQQ